MRIKSVTQWRGRVKSGGLDVMTVRGLGQEPAATTISSKGYTILTHVTCSVHFWTYICHQNSFHSNSFSSRVMRMSWVSQYFPCYTMLCWHTFTFVLHILLCEHSNIAYLYMVVYAVLHIQDRICEVAQLITHMSYCTRNIAFDRMQLQDCTRSSHCI